MMYSDEHFKSIGQNYKMVYNTIFRVTVPFLILIWMLLLVATFLDVRFLVLMYLFYFMNIKIFQMICFMTDRILCGFYGYYTMQNYYHAYFEVGTKWLLFKQGFLYWYGFHPYYRCRAGELKKWYHNVYTVNP